MKLDETYLHPISCPWQRDLSHLVQDLCIPVLQLPLGKMSITTSTQNIDYQEQRQQYTRTSAPSAMPSVTLLSRTILVRPIASTTFSHIWAAPFKKTREMHS